MAELSLEEFAGVASQQDALSSAAGFPRISAAEQASRDQQADRIKFAETQPNGGGLIPTSTVVRGSKATKAASTEMSLDDFAGTAGMPPAAPSSWDQTAASFKNLVGNAAALGDMVLNLPAQLIGVGADIGARAYGVGSQTDRRTSAQAGALGREIAEPISNPLQKLMKSLGYGESYDNSQVSTALQTLGSWIDKGGEWIEKKTNGGLLKEDVSALVNTAMASGSMTGLKAGKDYLTRVPGADALRNQRGINPGEQPPGPSYRGSGPQSEWLPPEVPRPAAQLPYRGPVEKDITPAANEMPLEEFAGGQKALPLLPDWAKTLGIGIGVYGAAQLQGQDAMDSMILGAAALAVKQKGGMWHPKAAETLAYPMSHKLLNEGEVRAATRDLEIGSPEYEAALAKVSEPAEKWAFKASQTYLNRHMGTEGDPLRDIEIPFGEGTKKWGEVTDTLISSQPAKALKYDGPLAEQLQKVPLEEPIWNVENVGRPTNFLNDNAATRIKEKSSQALKSYLSHVGDYLRQNVDPSKLPQYDLVRAVKETSKNDERVAKEMEKAAAASTKDLPIHKEYPDGMKWVELKLPERLTEEQWKGVRPVTSTTEFEYGDSGSHVAIEADGKPIRNSYTGAIATGKTPEEAYLAGHLAREGNQMGHCVGGYCEGVASGESRIFSLRDSKGKSHVTVEIQPADIRSDRISPVRYYHDVASDEFRAAHPIPTNALSHADRTWRNSVIASEEYRSWKASQPDDILQIKGKQNRAPNSEYLPYVQDFVKGGKWGEVGDLENTGLIHGPGAVREELGSQDIRAAQIQRELADNPYVTNDEYAALKSKYGVGNPTERGSIDPKLLARLAAAGIGLTAGVLLDPDHPISSGILGAVGALVATRISPKGFYEGIKNALKPGELVKIDDLVRETQYARRAANRTAWQLQNRIIELVPKEAGRVKITHWMEGDKTITLMPNELKAAGIIQKTYAYLGQMGLSSGALNDLVRNYVTHLWGDKNGSNLFNRMFNAPGGSGTSVNTPFSKTRKIPTLAEGKAQGYTPLTEDIAQILGVYTNSLTRAVENRRFLASLRAATDHQGGRLIQKARTAPEDYVGINHPQLLGVKVHPDIAADVKFIFDQNNPGAVVKGLEAISTVQKRMAVSFSLFHSKALEDAMMGATAVTKAPVRAVKSLAQSALPSVFGRDPLLKQLRTGGAGDLVDRGMRAGLQFSLEREGPALEELNSGFYQALKIGAQFLDETLPHAGAPIRGFEKMNHAFDSFMWGRLHASLKLNTFAEKSAQLSKNNGAAHAKDPRVPLKSVEETDRMAASFANDIYGGLNWQGLVQETSTRWGRELSQAVLSPTGRRAMRIMLFAPDWTISTTRAAIKAFGKGSGIEGLMKPETVADLHRQYILRSAFWFTLIAGGMNEYFSGHPIWENKDPTRVDLGDGRTMQWSKHSMEPVHWITDFWQQGLNKLGVVPKEIANQALGTEYLRASGNQPKMKGSRLSHLLRQFNPISVQQQFESGSTAQAAAGFFGAPIYGKTADQRMEERTRRRLERLKERLNKEKE